MLAALDTRAPIGLIVASLAILATAFGFQYLGNLQPCVLCVWQRWPYGVVIGLAVLALIVPWRGARAALIALAGVALLVDAGIAGFHVGVEQHWWPGLASCGGGVDLTNTNDIDALREQLLAAPVVRCDAVAWSLFGVSMAGFNFLLAVGLGVAALASAWILARRPA